MPSVCMAVIFHTLHVGVDILETVRVGQKSFSSSRGEFKSILAPVHPGRERSLSAADGGWREPGSLGPRAAGYPRGPGPRPRTGSWPAGPSKAGVPLFLEQRGSSFRTGLFYCVEAADFEISLVEGQGCLVGKHSFQA